MFAWLLKKIKTIFTGKKPKFTNRNQVKTLSSQKVAVKYCLAAIAFFGIQGVLASGGALDTVFPDLPIPVAYSSGRAMHLNLAIYWPLIGTLGVAYYYTVNASKTELHSVKIANIQFWIMLLSLLGNLGTLLLGFTSGREYLEALTPFKAGIMVGLILFIYNLVRTMLKKPRAFFRPIPLITLTGIVLTAIVYIPTFFTVKHPAVDDMIRFWLVHLWEESVLELVLSAIIAAVLVELAPNKKAFLEKMLLVEASLLIFTGTLATGHHYYWIGFPRLWIFIGGITSLLQLTPIGIMVYTTRKAFTGSARLIREPACKFILAGVFWNVVGVGILGLLIATPPINRYVHGTFLTSSHSHLALFGMFGQFVIGASAFILEKYASLNKKEKSLANSSFWLINTGLVVMALSLSIAGLVETYSWRVLGTNFGQVIPLLKPYLWTRFGGGLIFVTGEVIFAYIYLIHVIKNLKNYLMTDN